MLGYAMGSFYTNNYLVYKVYVSAVRWTQMGFAIHEFILSGDIGFDPSTAASVAWNINH